MKPAHVQLLRQAAEDAGIFANSFDHEFEVFEEGDVEFKVRCWPDHLEGDQANEASTIAAMRVVEYLNADNNVVPMIHISLDDGDSEVVIGATDRRMLGRAVFAVMYL